MDKGKKALVKIFNDQIEVLREIRDNQKQIIKLLKEIDKT